MNIIGCLHPCRFQIDGLCRLERVPQKTADIPAGAPCAYFQPPEDGKKKTQPV